MDSKVSARVPIETRKHADEKLKELGASTTQLINAAYDYVIETGELPQAKTKTPLHGGKLSDDQQELLRKRLRKTTHAVPASFFSERSDDEILEEELRRAYEALA